MASVLTRYFAIKSLERLLTHLSAGMQGLTRSLIGTMGEDGKARVADIHNALFPASTKASANASLNRLLSVLNEAAANHGVPVRVMITADKKIGADKRMVWCEGEAPGPAAPYLSELNAIPGGALRTSQRAVEVSAPIVLLTFNGHETRAVRDLFCGPNATPPTDASGQFPVTNLGRHGGVEVLHIISQQGQLHAFRAAQEAAKRYRPLAVIAVGIAFGMNPPKQRIGDVLVSDHVRDYELGRLNADGTFIPRGARVPAADWLLNRIRLLEQTNAGHPLWPRLEIGTVLSGNKLMDDRVSRDALKKIEPEAIGGEMEGSGVEVGARDTGTPWIVVKAICDWGDGTKNTGSKEADQRLAADNAAMVVKAMLDLGPFHPDGHGPGGGRPTPCQPPPSPRLHDRQVIPDGHFRQDARGRAVSLHKDDLATTSNGTPAIETPGEMVLPHLHRWVAEQDGPPMLALLGEYGMGKTITCQQFVRELDAARQQDARKPLALYFDLRHVSLNRDRPPTLEETLTECMARGWLDRGEGRGFTLDNVHEWIAQGAVVILDGFDEVLVKLDAIAGRNFTNNLLKLAADAEERARAAKRPLRLKMLVTCRTHYFPTLRDQQTHFTGQERGETDASRYRALLLLPWTEKQIQGYLAAALPDLDIGQVEAIINAVHNLKEVVARPFTLKLVSEFIPELEQRRAAGLPVSGVTLYRAMVQRWLERDNTKHNILPEHKLRLAAHLAAFLWRSKRGTLTADQLQTWFHDWRDGQKAFRRYNALLPDQLEEDLRTATFLVRQDDEDGSSFRFAHTSMQEFFLADYLYQAICDNRPDDWAIAVPSQETLDFLGQMLADDPAPMTILQGWRRTYRAQASELLLAYALRAHKRGWPVPLLRGIQLAGAQLREWQITGDAAGLDLSAANLSGADLRDTTISDTRLQGVDFSNARMDRATLVDCRLDKAGLQGASLAGTVFRRCALADTQWQGAQTYRTQLLLCAATPATDDAGLLFAPDPRVGADGKSGHLTWLTGHNDRVRSCAWSADGRLASAGDDGTLLVWDPVSGEVTARLTGHHGIVLACAWSTDGRLASAGQDGTLRVWDPSIGEATVVLTGHNDWVRACAWSADGRLASAGDDGTLLVWDPATGETTARLTGRSGLVRACAWSADGQLASAWSADGRLAAAGEDGTLIVWNPASGEVTARLTVHSGLVRACAWSADGRLASAGDDGTLLVCDPVSGEVTAVVTGYSGLVMACAWSADGRLAAAGDDGTLLVWNPASEEVTARLTGHSGGVLVCVWSADGRLAAAGDDGSLRVWDPARAETTALLTGHGGEVNGCAWSADGRLAAAGDDGTLLVWDPTSGEVATLLPGHSGWVGACAWSADGRLASAGEDGTLRVWDTVSGEDTARITEHSRLVLACAWSADGRLASAGEDGTVRVWDTASGQATARLTGHNDWVWACAWSADGRLASAGEDGTVRVWVPATGEVTAVLTGHSGRVQACAWSADGRLASAGADGTLRVWDPVSGETLSVYANWRRADGSFGHVAWSVSENRVLFGSDDAWRYLAWMVRDDAGRLTRLPLETFGPVPLDPLR